MYFVVVLHVRMSAAEISKGISQSFPDSLVFTSLFPDIGEIYARLFDHTPFTSSEIQYCLREFEVLTS